MKHASLFALLVLGTAMASAQIQTNVKHALVAPATEKPSHPAGVVKPALPPSEKTAAPVVPDALKYRLLKAKAAAADAQLELEHSKVYRDFYGSAELQKSQALGNAFSLAVQELQKVCGTDYQISMSAQGDPECVARPKVPLTPAVKPAKK
jgi:hypothetical protein